jgi:hypothetical protein
MLNITEGEIKNGQSKSRDTGNIEHTRHSMKTNKIKHVTHRTIFLKKDSYCYYVKFIFIESIYLLIVFKIFLYNYCSLLHY